MNIVLNVIGLEDGKMKLENNKCNFCKKYFKDYLSNHRKYCSKNCFDSWQQGKRHSPASEFKKGGLPPTHKIGEKTDDGRGYVMVWKPSHSKAHRGRVFEHRLVLEDYLGRSLNEDEIVHHINKDKKDNRLSNLEIMTRRDHALTHV